MGKIIKKSIIENVPFLVLMGVSIAMGIIAFFTPPRYDIPKSVLSFISLMLAFAALWTVFVALKKGIDARFTHKDTSLELNNPDSNTQKNRQNDEEQT